MVTASDVKKAVTKGYWNHGLIVDENIQARTAAYATLYYLASVVGAHADAGDWKRFERLFGMLRNLCLGIMPVSWAVWYLLVVYRANSALDAAALERLRDCAQMLYPPNENSSYDTESLERIIRTGLDYGHEHHACRPGRAAEDSTLVTRVVDTHARNYF